MKISEAVKEFIAIVATHFPPPKFDDDGTKLAWVESMQRNLGHYEPHVLKAAADLIVDERGETYGTRKFPLPKECRQACHTVIGRRQAEKRSGTLPISGEQASPYADWRTNLADDLILTPLGREAAKGGWVLGLHDFARREGRAPQDREVDQIKREAKEFDQAYERSVRGGWPEARNLEALGRSMLARRELFRRRVLGEAA